MNVTEAKSVIANIRDSIWSVYCCQLILYQRLPFLNYY